MWNRQEDREGLNSAWFILLLNQELIHISNLSGLFKCNQGQNFTLDMKATEKILISQLLLFLNTEGHWWSWMEGTDQWWGLSLPSYSDFKHLLLLNTFKLTTNKTPCKNSEGNSFFGFFFYFFSSEHFLWFSRSSTLLRIPFYYLVLDTQWIIREHSFTQQILFAFCFLFKPLKLESYFFSGFLSHHIKKTNVITLPHDSTLQK